MSQTDESRTVRHIFLIVLIFQTTALALTLRYSRARKVDGELQYIASTAILLAEIIKFLSCILPLAAENNWRWKRLTSEIYMEFVSKGKTTLKVGVPALLYFLQNNLLFLAISKLDAATYQVTYQLKILTTAFFSVTMLGKNLSGVKWFSLVLLAGGVALIQIPNNVGAVDAKSKIWFKMNSDQFTGLLAVFSACFLSGFSGVYFERILKDSQVSVWMRNFQLAFFSIICGVLAVYSYDWNLIAKDGYFQGYNAIVWTVILLQAGGGIVIAYVVKYADNILKGFAVSLSIILSSLFSYWILADFQPSMHFIIGATIVIVSTFLYGY